MRNNNLWIRASVIMVIFAISFSCDFDDTNVDPALPSDASMSSILPAGQAALSWAIGGESVRFSGILMQHFTGINAQQADHTKYQITETTVDGMWTRLYRNSLNTCTVLAKKAKEKEAPHYEGVAKVLIATGMIVLTDAFGNVPYSQAFQADQGNTTPTYDSQETLYNTTLPALLDEAVGLLGAANSIGGSPSNTDLIYRGNRNKWIKAANSLKVRLLVQKAQRSTDSYDKALDLLKKQEVISSNDEDFEMNFGTGDAEVGPQYQFTQSRSGNVKISDYFVGALKSEDTRKDFFVGKDATGNYTKDSNFEFLGYYTKKNSPVVLMSYVELKFLEAESFLMKGASDEVSSKKAMDEAIEASFMKITGGTTPQVYKDSVDNSWTAATTQQKKLEILIAQKYIACYSQGLLAWNDYRRTGYPNITPNPKGENGTNPTVGGVISVPRRLPYPQLERLLNVKNIPTTSPNLQDRFWWDKK